MSRLMFVYLSGTEKGKTRIFKQEHVTIGTSDACDLRLVPEEGGVLPDGVLADVFDEDGAFHMVARGENRFDLTVNGENLLANAPAGHPLHDGDTVHFGRGLSSASILFQVMPENFSASSIARREARDLEQIPANPPHPLTATLFVKELSASLWAEIPLRAKRIAVISIGAIAVLMVALLVFGLVTLVRNTNKTDRLAEQIFGIQARRDQDAELIKNQQEEIERLREATEQTRRFTQRIAEVYSPGVCLIVGSYSFIERGTGRALRYETADNTSDMPVDKNGNLRASVDGAGSKVQIDYTGTGFLVDGGLIATNKHVVQPWVTDQLAQIILNQGGGFAARLDTLEAFFPSIQTPFDLKVSGASANYDVAICKFEQGETAVPLLPMSHEDPSQIIGEPVVLLGYPTGVDGLLQRIEEDERREILKEHGQSAMEVAAGLAARGLIRPLTTTGTISDALPGRIVHSAQTTEGGSGSPMFDRDGRVIAINSAILASIDGNQSFGGSNFGVPIRHAYEMIEAYDKDKSKLTGQR
jgi:S1-C subfamily serine protease